jgi:hypothetical protein
MGQPLYSAIDEAQAAMVPGNFLQLTRQAAVIGFTYLMIGKNNCY